ncbi:MAG: L,D-transpeptidase, partial [Patescibacteria group bacterium]|nr:L,D-transpeptidase [Patescibacteria group bacterium]
MKKLSLIFLFLFLFLSLFFVGTFVAPFFISQIATIETVKVFPHNFSTSTYISNIKNVSKDTPERVLENGLDGVLKIAASKDTTENIPEDIQEDVLKKPVYLKMISDAKNNLVFEMKNFLEVNFSAMKIRIYQKGIFVKEFPILAIGDPYEWGGSPLGLYRVMSKNRNSFSATSNVYMPYALRYYGK